MEIYWLLIYSNPQSLIDLDSYQKRRHRKGIAVLQETPNPERVNVQFDYKGEGEDFGKLMTHAPSRSRE